MNRRGFIGMFSAALAALGLGAKVLGETPDPKVSLAKGCVEHPVGQHYEGVELDDLWVAGPDAPAPVHAPEGLARWSETETVAPPKTALPGKERDADLERRLRALHAEVESFYRALWLP